MPIRFLGALTAAALTAVAAVAGGETAASRLLDPRSIDPVLLLPPPPSDPAALRRDLDEVRTAVATASAAERAQAAYDDAHEDPSLFDRTIGSNLSLSRLPATWALLKQVQGEAEDVATRAKIAFPRTRPWGEDPRLIPCEAIGSRTPTRSYPSGHAMLGWSVGLVLAELLPDRAPAILARARTYAYERMVCAEHHPSDIEASHALAAIVVTRLEELPGFRSQLDAAHTELQRAVGRPRGPGAPGAGHGPEKETRP